jgi:hypothetical protein
VPGIWGGWDVTMQQGTPGLVKETRELKKFNEEQCPYAPALLDSELALSEENLATSHGSIKSS